MKILLFLIGIAGLILTRLCTNNEHPMKKRQKYVFYILSVTIITAFSYGYSLNIITILFILVLSILLNVAFIDYRYGIIPNKLVLPIFIIAIVNFILNISMYKSLLFGMLFAIIFCFIIYKLSNFGGGDVKLLISLSLLIGFSNTFLLFLISFFLGSIYGIMQMIRKKANLRSAIPFGPFITVAFIILCFI